jgi:serine/threonine-protein kinase
MVLVSYYIVGRFVHGTELKSPNLTGLTILDALKILQKDNLSLKLERDQPHDSIPEGSIISQFPPPEGKIKKGTAIRVVVSLGTHLLQVPELRGESKIQARSELRNLGLNVDHIAVMPSTGTAGGIVLATDPPGGTGVPPGSAVNMVISSGKNQAAQIMPNLQGLTLEKARDELFKYSLFIAEERPSASDKGQPGQIFSQLPAAGEAVTETTHIIVSYVPAEAKEASESPATKTDNYETTPTDLTDNAEKPAPAETPAPKAAPAANSPSLPAVDSSSSSQTLNNEQ